MKGLTYISAIDGVLAEYRYSITEDGYTFMIEKKDGLYSFLCMDYFNKLQQYATKEQIDVAGLEFIAKEIEEYFFNHK